MSYPTVTVERSSKLGKPTGIGQGRQVEGTIEGAFRTFQSFPAGSFGLRSVHSIQLTPGSYFRAGTPVTFIPTAQVNSPGSPDNSVVVSCRQVIADTVRCGSTARYVTFTPAFASTPIVILTPGSPVSDTDLSTVSGGTPNGYWIVETVTEGSFSHCGTPTITANYEAIGPGSLSLNFVANGP
jgi:hypothetical protein